MWKMNNHIYHLPSNLMYLYPVDKKYWKRTLILSLFVGIRCGEYGIVESCRLCPIFGSEACEGDCGLRSDHKCGRRGNLPS